LLHAGVSGLIGLGPVLAATAACLKALRADVEPREPSRTAVPIGEDGEVDEHDLVEELEATVARQSEPELV
jgi:hypothetical protein